MGPGSMPPPWKRAVAELYFAATCLPRRWHGRRLAARGKAPIAVLVFHRIADDAANNWTTPTGEFLRTIDWLQAHCELISLAELQTRMAGSSDRLAACVTFDDGYADNCRVAIPALIERRIPCTYFVSSDAVLKGVHPEHDTRMGNRLAMNTVRQLRDMSSAGIEIGAHTRTHADLGALDDPRELVDELVTARDDLEAALGEPIRYFAFPFGCPEHLSANAFRLARAAGYQGVCSAYGRWNRPGDDPFHIRRRCIDGPLGRSRGWTVIDPVRERLLPDFTPPPVSDLPPELEEALVQAGGARRGRLAC